MTRYENLRNKAELCRLNARKSPAGSWARNYWNVIADDLETESANLPLCKAATNYFEELKLQRGY